MIYLNFNVFISRPLRTVSFGICSSCSETWHFAVRCCWFWLNRGLKGDPCSLEFPPWAKTSPKSIFNSPGGSSSCSCLWPFSGSIPLSCRWVNRQVSIGSEDRVHRPKLFLLIADPTECGWQFVDGVGYHRVQNQVERFSSGIVVERAQLLLQRVVEHPCLQTHARLSQIRFLPGNDGWFRRCHC